MTAILVKRVWTWEDLLGAEAPSNVDKRAVVAEWLWFQEGVRIEDATSEEINRLTYAMRFCPLFSVVKADIDGGNLDLDECGGWHSEASGKRVKPAWFIDTSLIGEVADAVLTRRSESGDSAFWGESV